MFNAQQFVYVPYVDLRRALDAGAAGRAAARRAISNGQFDDVFRAFEEAKPSRFLFRAA